MANEFGGNTMQCREKIKHKIVLEIENWRCPNNIIMTNIVTNEFVETRSNGPAKIKHKLEIENWRFQTQPVEEQIIEDDKSSSPNYLRGTGNLHAPGIGSCCVTDLLSTILLAQN